MTKQELMVMAKKNAEKALKNYKYNYHRKGITEAEKEGLEKKVEYAVTVLRLIKEHVED